MLRILKVSPEPVEQGLFIRERYTPTRLSVPKIQPRKPLATLPGPPGLGGMITGD